MKRVGLGLALLLASTALSQANFIEIGVALSSGPISTVASGQGTASVSGAVLGPFTINASGTDSPPLTGVPLLGGTIAVSARQRGILHPIGRICNGDRDKPVGLAASIRELVHPKPAHRGLARSGDVFPRQHQRGVRNAATS